MGAARNGQRSTPRKGASFAADILDDGKNVSLSGHQIRHIRRTMGDSQKTFAERLAVTQPTIVRMEKHGDELMTGPQIILAKIIARVHGVDLSRVEPEVDASEQASAGEA